MVQITDSNGDLRDTNLEELLQQGGRLMQQGKPIDGFHCDMTLTTWDECCSCVLHNADCKQYYDLRPGIITLIKPKLLTLFKSFTNKITGLSSKVAGLWCKIFYTEIITKQKGEEMTIQLAGPPDVIHIQDEKGLIKQAFERYKDDPEKFVKSLSTAGYTDNEILAAIYHYFTAERIFQKFVVIVRK